MSLLSSLFGGEERAARRTPAASAKALLPGPRDDAPAPASARPDTAAPDPLATARALAATGDDEGEEGEPAAARSLAPQAGGAGGGFYGDPVLSAMAAAEWAADELLGLPAVEASISLIAGTIASLPAVVMAPDEHGLLQPVPGHGVTRLLAAPNRYMTGFEFMERLVADVATHGAGAAVITRDGRGAPADLRYLPPSAIQPERSPRSLLVFYRVSDPDENTSYILPDEDTLFVRYRINPRDRLTGISPVRLGAKTLRLAASSVTYAGAMFRNRSVPGAIITTEKPLSPKAKNNLRAQIARFFSGEAAGQAMVLEGTSRFELVGHTLRDAQLVETSEALTAAVARLFGVPPALIGQAGNLNFSAMREVVTNWVRLGLRPWLVRMEQALEDKLLSEDAKSRGLVIRFDTSELLRLDSLDRARFGQVMVTAGIYTPNELRRAESLPPIENGDTIQRTPGAAVAPGPGRDPGSGATDDLEPGTGSAPGGREG